eukprot:1910334-Pyramimonas_sp.AAC.1
MAAVLPSLVSYTGLAPIFSSTSTDRALPRAEAAMSGVSPDLVSMSARAPHRSSATTLGMTCATNHTRASEYTLGNLSVRVHTLGYCQSSPRIGWVRALLDTIF